MQTHLRRPLLRRKDLVQMRLVREARRNASRFHVHHEMEEQMAVNVCREVVAVLEGNWPQKIKCSDVLAPQQVPQQRRRDLFQLVGALDEARDDLVRRTQGLEDVLLQAVDVVVRWRRSDLAPATGTLCHGVDGLLTAPADVHQAHARLALSLSGPVSLPDLLRHHFLCNHAGRVHVQLVAASVVPAGVAPLDLDPSLVVSWAVHANIPVLIYPTTGPAVGFADAWVE
mmetsp:Transcript_93311/g.237473  ORF Transcript_93311/g.237473 Transcript_93311/m.237473 type:complete len:228 (-) Transcript_93311:274-957(-)